MSKVTKMILGLTLVFLLLLVGCSNNASTVDDLGSSDSSLSDSDAEETNETVISLDDNETETNIDVMVDPTTEEVEDEDEDEDEYSILEVPESFVREIGGFYLLRDGKFYTLSGRIPKSDVKSREVGFYGPYDEVGSLYGTCLDNNVSEVVSLGDVPLLHFQDGDKIVGFADRYGGGKTLWLRECDFIGRSLCVWDRLSFGVYIVDDVYAENINVVDSKEKDTIEVVDKNGNVVDDYRNLEYGETYIVSWFSGTDYHEVELPAVCNFYVSNNSSSSEYKEYELEGMLSKESYAEFDLSSIPPGTYLILGETPLQID